MKNTLETRLGMFAAVIVIAALLLLEMVGTLDALREGHRIHARFDNARELKAGDRVKLAGVEVGRVERIELEEEKARVTMWLRADARVRADSVAVIRFAGLMGQNFVALSFGSPAAALAVDGAELPTAEQPDLNALMVKLDAAVGGVEELTRNFSPEQLLGPINELVHENRTNATEALENLRAISSQIREGRGTLGRLVMDDSLYFSALNTVTNLNAASLDLRLAFADARAGKGTVGRLLTDDALYNSAAASMTQLHEILSKVNRGEGTAGRLINDDRFYNSAKLTLQKLDRATEMMEDQGPVSVLGTLIGTFY